MPYFQLQGAKQLQACINRKIKVEIRFHFAQNALKMLVLGQPNLDLGQFLHCSFVPLLTISEVI